MLRRRILLAAACALGLTVAGDALGQDDEPDDTLRRPDQLTVSSADQFLGQLSRDGKTLYFVSNRNTTSEIYEEDLEEARARLLFDEGADVTWPRVSPDGRRLLYISFREHATGQLCVRDLPDGDHRRCLDAPQSAVQAEWMGVERIALVARPSIQGDLRVLSVRVGRRLKARPLLERNLTSPALSPDGRWIIYVPVERYVERVGPGFAARAAARLEAVRLDRSGPVQPLVLDLPGMTGQPAFSHDGRWLYVSQFMNDSNQDGVVDASDHGMLFRVPFASARDDAPARVARLMPEQLTDASWNCQYPAPAADTLIATCSRGRGLDVYQLPLDGEVPSDFGAARLRTELQLASRRSDELLLYRALLRYETSVTSRREIMMRLARLHLEFDEFDAARFYAEHIAALADPTTAGVARPLRLLIEHRRALRARERGRMAPEFGDDERERMAALQPEPDDSPAGLALERLVRSEIADALGDKGTARRELEQAEIDTVPVGSVLEAYYDRADALYRELDDREALATACRRLSMMSALGLDERQEYARAAVRAMVRGLPFQEADAVLARERARTADDTELAFALDLGRAVLAIRDERPAQTVGDALAALYRRQQRPDRRRAVILDAVGRAADYGADHIAEALAQLYVEDAPPRTSERRRAARLYRRLMLGRAYRRMAAGRTDEARSDFDAVAKRTGSFEGTLQSVQLRLRAGVAPEAVAAEYEQQGGEDSKPLARFVRAYLDARRLPQLQGEDHDGAARKALAELRAAWPELRENRVVQALVGAIHHERFLVGGNAAAAQRANLHYLIALDQVRRNPRYRAMILSQLALLHTEVGNYRIALGYLDEREKLPYADDTAGLAVRLARARALLHIDREADAATVAEQALSMVDRAPSLASYRVLALDRAALYSLAAGRFERALSLYDEELPLLETASGSMAERNRMVARLARAAAALGAGAPRRALADLALVDRALADPRVVAALQWPHATEADVLRDYRLIYAGLLANAERRLGRLAEAARALELRRSLFQARAAHSDRDEDLRELTLVEMRLADNARSRGDLAGAARWLDRALGHADAVVGRTHTPVDRQQLDVLWSAAALRTFGHAKLRFNLARRLRQAYRKMVAQQDPVWRSYERWFEVYLTLTSPLRRRAHASAEDVLDPLDETLDQTGGPQGSALPRSPMRLMESRLVISPGSPRPGSSALRLAALTTERRGREPRGARCTTARRCSRP